jgi:excisionase family DNA binding protein
MSTCTCEHRPLLTTKQAANYLGVSMSVLGHWRSDRRGPRYVQVGSSVRYRLADLDAWIQANTVNPAA